MRNRSSPTSPLCTKYSLNPHLSTLCTIPLLKNAFRNTANLPLLFTPGWKRNTAWCKTDHSHQLWSRWRNWPPNRPGSAPTKYHQGKGTRIIWANCSKIWANISAQLVKSISNRSCTSITSRGTGRNWWRRIRNAIGILSRRSRGSRGCRG